MKNEFKQIPIEFKKAPNESGEFEGYGSLFGLTDLGLDIVAPGAFTKSLETRNPKLLWQHDPSQPIGVWESVVEDDKGLAVKGRLLPEVAQAREASALMRAGALDGLSIGFRTLKAMWDEDSEIRTLLEVELFEISLVTFPMQPEATITSMKSVQTERDCERYLRDAGWSRKEATAAAKTCFVFLSNLRDAGFSEREAGAIANASFDYAQELRRLGLERETAFRIATEGCKNVEGQRDAANDEKNDDLGIILDRLAKLKGAFNV